ncbi:MAG TPA: class I SAM-dependent methyltransferase [Thermomicrobiaceae bacterium]|nr:class I SAM-dependent methyltransferase [Thermomicrobiaceae bacterium]
MEDPKRTVAHGYDRIGEAYAAGALAASGGDRARYLGLVGERLADGATVLDLGCGVGIPVARDLAARFDVTGVDISARNVALARRNVPAARFVHADMAALDLAPAAFDAVVAFYSIIHLPRAEHPIVLSKVARWLRPGGLFVASLGARDLAAGTEDDWLGVPMYWSHFDAERNRRLIEEAGLAIERAEETSDGDERFLWVVARLRGTAGGTVAGD